MEDQSNVWLEGLDREMMSPYAGSCILMGVQGFDLYMRFSY